MAGAWIPLQACATRQSGQLFAGRMQGYVSPERVYPALRASSKCGLPRSSITVSGTFPLVAALWSSKRVDKKGERLQVPCQVGERVALN